MITYLTMNPPTRMRTATSAVMAGAVFRMTPANWSANGTTIPMTTAPSQNGTPYGPATRCDSERAIPAEPDQRPRARVHRREGLEVERADGDGVHADGVGWLGHHQHVEKPRREAEVHGQQNRPGNHGQERDVVPDPDDLAVALAVEEVGDRGDHERPTSHPTEEEVDVDQGRPVRALEETGFHHASPCPPRPLNATSAPSPTIRAEPIDRSESTTTFFCGSLGFACSP